MTIFMRQLRSLAETYGILVFVRNLAGALPARGGG